MSDNPASAYDMSHVEEDEERRTLAILVDNEPGVLGRVVGCSRRVDTTLKV